MPQKTFPRVAANPAGLDTLLSTLLFAENIQMSSLKNIETLHNTGTFCFVTNKVVATDRSSLSNDATWGDYDNDGLPDLLVGNGSVHDFFYHNDGRGQFSRMTNSILEKYVGRRRLSVDRDL